MKRIGNRILLTLVTALLLALLTATAWADTIPGTAKLTITPTDTKVNGDTATVTYSVTVTPPEGKELGVFSIQFQPSDGMTLTQDDKKITLGDGNLTYDAGSKTGIFATYGYVPETGYFAAVGTTPERRMSQEATILTIQATMPANKDGTYTLGAEFIAALDGSGDVYTARVSTTPVTINGGKAPVAEETPVVTESNSETIGNSGTGTTANGGGTAGDGTAAPDGTTPDGTAPDGTAPDGSTPNTDPAGTDARSGGSAVLWIVIAVVVVAAVVVVILRKKKQ